jgi:hypothetical protein
MWIATYTRISTDEELQPYSFEAQATRLDSYVESQEDWQIVRRFTDQASKAILERDGLERALREAEAGPFDLLLVYRVDRLSRSVRGLAQILARLDDAEVSFRSATEPFDTASSAGRMMVQLLGAFADSSAPRSWSGPSPVWSGRQPGASGPAATCRSATGSTPSVASSFPSQTRPRLCRRSSAATRSALRAQRHSRPG